MKYLKLFDSKNEEKFSDITENDYLDVERQSLHINDIEKRKIESLIKENDKNGFRTPITVEYPKNTFTPLNRISCRIVVSYESYRGGPGKGMTRTILPTSYISIIKCDDEWFYVRDYYQETSLNTRDLIKKDIEYYKCDQLDGLLDCIHACIHK